MTRKRKRRRNPTVPRKSEMVSLRLTAAELRRLQRVARQQGQTVSDLVRSLVFGMIRR